MLISTLEVQGEKKGREQKGREGKRAISLGLSSAKNKTKLNKKSRIMEAI